MEAIASDVSAILLQTLPRWKLKIFAGHQFIQCPERILSKGNCGRRFIWTPGKLAGAFLLEAVAGWAHIAGARAHGMWTYEPRQGRKAATVVCSTSAVVTLALVFTIYDLRFAIAVAVANRA